MGKHVENIDITSQNRGCKICHRHQIINLSAWRTRIIWNLEQKEFTRKLIEYVTIKLFNDSNRQANTFFFASETLTDTATDDGCRGCFFMQFSGSSPILTTRFKKNRKKPKTFLLIMCSYCASFQDTSKRIQSWTGNSFHSFPRYCLPLGRLALRRRAQVKRRKLDSSFSRPGCRLVLVERHSRLITLPPRESQDPISRMLRHLREFR